MKFKGITLEPPKAQPLVLPIGGVDVVLMIKPVYDDSPFLDLSPRPEPPVLHMADGSKKIDVDDSAYALASDTWSRNSTTWRYLKALEDSEIEWEQVDINDVSTYQYFEQELSEAGFSRIYIHNILLKIHTLSGMNQALIEEATERFILGMGQEQ